MNKVKNYLLVGLLLYSTGLTINLCNRENQSEDLKSSTADLDSSSDTIFGKVKVPNTLDISIAPSTVILPLNPKTRSQEPNRDSVASVEINKTQLNITLNDSVGNPSQLRFKIDAQNYQYLWSEGQLTAKKLPWHKRVQLKPYIEATYRPLNNLTDIEGGIKLKTQHLTYKLGIQGFYYPQFQSQPGWDIQIGIQYEF